MYKYLTVLQLQLSLLTNYRMALLFTWIFRFVKVAVFYSLWSLTAKSTEDSIRLLEYFILFYYIFDPLSTGRVGRELADKIKTGEINQFLTKPISLPIYEVANNFMIMFARVIFPLIFILIFGFFNRSFSPAGIVEFIFFIIITIFGYLMWNSFILLTGAIAFWLYEIGSLQTTIDLLLRIVNGGFIPLYLFPDTFLEFLKYTPVPYLGAFQISVWQGYETLETTLLGLIICIVWFVIIQYIFKITYKLGLSKYEANGS